MKLRQHIVALLLAVVMLLSVAAPAAGAEPAAPESWAQVRGSVLEAGDPVDLTALGTRDWVYFNKTTQNEYTRKQGADLIQVTPVGSFNDSNPNSPNPFLYTDGTEGAPEGGATNVLMTVSEGSGFTFRLPGSVEPREVRLYYMSWGSLTRTSLSVNGQELKANVDGARTGRPGAQINEAIFTYATASHEDVVEVRLNLHQVTQGGGSVGFGAITLGTPADTAATVRGGNLPNGTEVELPLLGNLDWVHFNNNNPQLAARKADSSLIGVTPVGSYADLNPNWPATFRFEDASGTSVTDRNVLMVIQEGAGFTFTLPASTTPKEVRVYTMSWGSLTNYSLCINGKAVQGLVQGDEKGTPGAVAGEVVFTYTTASADDVVELRVTLQTVTVNYGSVGIGAVTLGGQEEPVNSATVADTKITGQKERNLTELGPLDWILFNKPTADGCTRKAGGDLINFEVIGKFADNNKSAPARYTYSDAAGDTPSGAETCSMLTVTEGSGYRFTLPASTQRREVRVYHMAWGSMSRAELLINGKVMAARDFGDPTGTPGAVANEVIFTYTTASEADQVEIVTKLEKCILPYSSGGVSAIALKEGSEEDGTATLEATRMDPVTSVNLTETGTLDWVIFNSNDVTMPQRKAMENPYITNLAKLPVNGGIGTFGSELHFDFTDGTPPQTQAGDGTTGLCYSSDAMGFTFQVPPVLEARTLHLYLSSWNSQMKVTVKQGRREVASTLFGKDSGESGAWYYDVAMSYSDLSPEEPFTVRVEKTADGKGGNIGILGAALSGPGQVVPYDPEKHMTAVNPLPDGTTQDLTALGTLDWIQFNSLNLYKSERKNVEEAYIQGLRELPANAGGGKGLFNPPIRFQYTDGTVQPQTPEGGTTALCYSSDSMGIEFQLPVHEENRVLHLFVSSWNSQMKLSVLKNGQVINEQLFGKADSSPGAPIYDVVLTYKGSQEDTPLTVRLEKTADGKGGNIGLLGAALSGPVSTPRPEPEEPKDPQELVISAEAGVTRIPNNTAVDLTAEGTLDWIYFDDLDLSKIERKATGLPFPYIDNAEPLPTNAGGLQDYYGCEMQLNFTDGTKTPTHTGAGRAVCYTRTGMGLRFTVPTYYENRTLHFYVSGWHSQYRIRILHGTRVLDTIVTGKADTNGAGYYRIDVDFSANMRDIPLTVELSQLGEPEGGNMGIIAATLEGARKAVRPRITVETETQDAPREVNLTDLGNVDWLAFAGADVTGTVRKNTETPAIVGPVPLSPRDASLTQSPVTLLYTDGTAEAAAPTMAMTCSARGDGVSFTVPTAQELRTLRVYTAVSEARVQILLKQGKQIIASYETPRLTTGAAETTFRYRADQGSQPLTVQILQLSETGTVSLLGAALSMPIPEPPALIDGARGRADQLAGGSTVNLTEAGTLDWISLDQLVLSQTEHKNIPNPYITNLENLVQNSNVSHFGSDIHVEYTDGTNHPTPPQGAQPICYSGKDMGIRFSIPAGTVNRTLHVYLSSWNSQIKVAVSRNGEILDRVFTGKPTSEPGAWAFDVAFDYGSLEEGVVYDVTVEQVSASGNMGLLGIAVDGVPGNVLEAEATAFARPSTVDVSRLGTLDWVRFNQPEGFLQKSHVMEVSSSGTFDGLREDSQNTFIYRDSPVEPARAEDHVGLAAQAGASWTLTLPGSDATRYLKAFVETEKALIRADLAINGKVVRTLTCEGEALQAAQLAFSYRTANPDDTVTLTLTAEEVQPEGRALFQAVTFSDRADMEPVETLLSNDNWEVQISDGRIVSLSTRVDDTMTAVPMRSDRWGLGVLWEGQFVQTDYYTANEDGTVTYYADLPQGVRVSVTYFLTEAGQLSARVSMDNTSPERIDVNKVSLNLGFDTYLDTYPEYLDKLFTNLMRCENTHLWGYLQSPGGLIMTVATDKPVAAYSQDYKPGAYAHHIYTSTLDLLVSGKVPQRVPRGLDHLDAGETREWVVSLKPVAQRNAVEKITSTLAESTPMPYVQADRYSLHQGEVSNLTIYSSGPIASVKVLDEAGNVTELTAQKTAEGIYTAQFRGSSLGTFRVQITNEAGYRAEAHLSVMAGWSWYMQAARQAALDIPQAARLDWDTSCECWYGLHSGYLAQKYWPDNKALDSFDRDLKRVVSAVFDFGQGAPTMDMLYWERVQNQEALGDILMERYEATGDRQTLMAALDVVNYLIDNRQREDGAIGGYGMSDYTSVLYPAKTIMTMMAIEKRLMADENTGTEDYNFWQANYEKQFNAVKKAMDHLVDLDGNFQTEGEHAFEDGANACTVSQLSMFALLYPQGSPERQRYLDAALKIMEIHESHQQVVNPDSRMNGATLRFWETPEVYLNYNAMSSPHGWSGWILYGLFYVYELTGDLEYLQRGMNAMGTDVQLMGPDGTLRWAFIPDAHRQVELCVRDEGAPLGDGRYNGKYVDYTISEEYLPHVGYWSAGNSGQTGHEIFKAMAELALTKAYVHQNPDGSFTTYNCTAETDEDGTVVVTPAESVVNKVSVCLNEDGQVRVGGVTAPAAAHTVTWIQGEEQEVRNISLIEEPAPVKAAYGTALQALELPETVSVTLEDDSAAQVPVTWSCLHYNSQDPGVYTFEGKLDLPYGITNTEGLTVQLLVTLLPDNFVTVFVMGDKEVHVAAPVGEEARAPEVPQREGYTFVGWFTEPEGGQEVTEFRVAQTVYARYEKNLPPIHEVFRDVKEGAWYYDFVESAYNSGLMQGVSADTFAPNGKVTRAQVVTILYRMVGEPDAQGLNNPFTDVAQNQWFTDAILWANEAGVVKGLTADTFGPQKSVTREQLAAMLYRFVGSPGTEGDLRSFPDAGDVSPWAEDALLWATEAGILQGIGGRLSPRTGATRAQLATMLCRLDSLEE